MRLPQEKIGGIGAFIQSTVSLVCTGRYTNAVEGWVEKNKWLQEGRAAWHSVRFSVAAGRNSKACQNLLKTFAKIQELASLRQ